MDYKYDVFISYSRKDTKIADSIAKEFESNDITYFIDRQGIGGGMEFPAILAKAIRESKVFLFLASKNSYESKFTQSEIVYAFNKKRKEDIIPYIIDGSNMPEELEFTFSAINWRRIEDHPINPVLIDDILVKIDKQRKESEGKRQVVNKKNNVFPSVTQIKETIADFNFSGKHLAWIVLSLSVLLFIIVLLLTKNFIQDHYSTINHILMISIIILFIPSIVGLIRPASVVLKDRKEVLKYYISSFAIVFFALTSIVGNDPNYDNIIDSTDDASQQADTTTIVTDISKKE